MLVYIGIDIDNYLYMYLCLCVSQSICAPHPHPHLLFTGTLILGGCCLCSEEFKFRNYNQKR